MDDIFILKIERGKDIPVTLTGEYERSCYGVSLEELVFTIDPIRNTPLPVNIPVMNNDSEREPVLKQAIPKELWRLIDALWTSGALREKDLFGETADENEVTCLGSWLAGPYPTVDQKDVTLITRIQVLSKFMSI